jgi:type IV pilus assembly protein PilN
MRIAINLASRPFIELRPLFLRLRLLMILLAAVAIGLGIWAHILEKRLDRAAAQMDALRNQTIAAQHERLQNEARMRQPANAAVLDRAHFLNALFLRKSFSWTAVMMDLENVLPTGVQVTSIAPQPTQSGDVIIRLRVSGERDHAVQLVRNLEHSRRFLQPRLSGEASQAKTTTAANGGFRQPQMNVPTAPAGVEFDILANYNPLPEGESYAKPSTAKRTATTRTRGAGR